MDNPVAIPTESKAIVTTERKNPSAVQVTVAGTGGGGTNLARGVAKNNQVDKVLFFDTSNTNTKHGETVEILTASGSGSGSHRASNAPEIERSVTQLSDDQMGINHVAIVTFSLGGGSGSVIGPILIREYAKRGARVIGVAIADTSSTVNATNTLNTLKTLTSICKNNDIYLPMVIVSNDYGNRREVNTAVDMILNDIIDLLTKSVYEVDRNDRLNFINPTKVVSSDFGMKILSMVSNKTLPNPKVVLGNDSNVMVDSLLILQSDDEDAPKLPPARLKKVGFYDEKYHQVIGRVSSDITSVEAIIDAVEKMNHQDKAQKNKTVDRLHTNDDSDLIF